MAVGWRKTLEEYGGDMPEHELLKTEHSPEYIQLLISRLNYFKDKKITDLDRDEIREYLNLKEEVVEVFPEVRKAIESIWGAIKEAHEPYLEAEKKYHERVLNK